MLPHLTRVDHVTLFTLVSDSPQIISNSSELSNAFNNHFSTVGPRLANEIPPIANNNSSYTNM